jgi:hypothetical protein
VIVRGVGSHLLEQLFFRGRAGRERAVGHDVGAGDVLGRRVVAVMRGVLSECVGALEMPPRMMCDRTGPRVPEGGSR